MQRLYLDSGDLPTGKAGSTCKVSSIHKLNTDFEIFENMINFASPWKRVWRSYMKKRIAFKTVGCRLNQYETDAIASQFAESGFEVGTFDTEADVYVINTCTVTSHSDQKSRNLINQAIRKKEGAVVVVTGCLANNYKEELQKRNDITYVIENSRKSGIFSLIDVHFKGEGMHPDQLKPDLFGYTPASKTFHTRSMIKIQEGCDNFCSFCIVPMVRGRATSRPVDDILGNIRQVLNYGFREIVLTGVNIGRYSYENVTFEKLVSNILDLHGDFRLRISSMEPEGLGDDFFTLLEHPKMTPHLHLCLQSGSDRILTGMRRMYDVKTFISLVSKIRSLIPDFNITTDIMVGFPGETEDDFRQTREVIETIGFGHIHTFKYSIREGTRAERMENQIPEEIKNSRSKIIRDLSDKQKLSYRSAFIGKTQRVLIEKVQGKQASGYGQHYIPVLIEGENLERNSFVDCTLTGIMKGDEPVLIGG